MGQESSRLALHDRDRRHEECSRMGDRRFEKEEDMPVKLDHTVVTARDKTESATFLAEVLGLGTPVATGHFLAVALDNGPTLDFCSVEEGAIRAQHFAFEVSEAEFDGVLGRVKGRSVPYWADPRQTRPGEVDQRGNGRAIYFADPSGHWLEVLTRN